MKQPSTRAVRIGQAELGAGAPLLVQSMCATKTTISTHGCPGPSVAAGWRRCGPHCG